MPERKIGAVHFTVPELRVILTMAGVTLALMNDGKHEPWTKSGMRAFNSLRRKASKLLEYQTWKE